MSSPNLSLADFGSLDISCEVLSTKETQTSCAYIVDSIASSKDPSRPLPKCLEKSTDAPVNIDCCHILKHPSDTITVDTLKASYTNESTQSSDSISDSEFNQLRYCQEVVKPYLKTNLNDCKDNDDSLEKLIQNALEDFPDYQPCEDKVQEKKEGANIKMETSKKSQEAPNKESAKVKKCQKKSVENSKPKCPKKSEDNSKPKGPKNTEENTKSKPSPCPSSTNLIKSSLKPACPDNFQLPLEYDEELEKSKEPSKSISRESITKCVKDSLTALKRSASSCIEKMEVVIGIKKPEKAGEKPIYYPLEKHKLKCSPSQNVQTETGNSLKNLINEHSEKIHAIKETVKDIAGKFYKTSKDAVTLITSESAKILNKAKSEVYSADDDDSQPKPKEKKLKKVSADSIKNYLFQKAQNKPKKEDPPKCEDLAVPKPAIESSPSLLQQRLSLNKLRDDIVRSKFEKSSPFDKPMPKEVSNKMPQTTENRIPSVSAIEPEPESSANMFTMLKAKFFSMFQDEGEKAAMEPMVQESPEQDEEEEDPFERFYEQ